jgi:hypothetical protein
MCDIDFAVAVVRSWIKDIQDMRTKVSLQKLTEGNSLQQKKEDEKIITKIFLRSKVHWCAMSSHDQDTSRCRALVNMLINIIVS